MKPGAMDWERLQDDAPAALRRRVREYVVAAPAAAPAERLAGAGEAALARVLAGPEDRSAALDLLAADALVTMALLVQAGAHPERLADWARAVRWRIPPPPAAAPAPPR